MARVIMVQGTMSNAGKSLVAAGLCRVFRQDGWRVAPFKSQNMALNSFVTKEGLEMGRAQVMQAEAAGVEPCAAMNPILLKPTSDVGSQVIVNGIPRGNMDARDYFAYKTELIPDIRRAFGSLARWADIIVVEGAGSPAEINLKENDIVNMGLAKILDAPVLLVGDIDRGGVFAQLVGTVELLEEEERQRIQGFVINKFRGDPSLLTSGVDMLTKKTGIPTLGILPYIHVRLDDEDSLSSRLEEETTEEVSPADDPQGTAQTAKSSTGARTEHGHACADIAVVRLPHISNFTDFDVFDAVEDARIRYISSPGEIRAADLLILPGSKNTVDDLSWLWRSGMAEAICRYADAGKPVWGICGGYQMLGLLVEDPDHMESRESSQRGLGLLPVITRLGESKILAQVEGTFLAGSAVPGLWAGLAGMRFEGYEIHMGMTQIVGSQGHPFVRAYAQTDEENLPIQEEGKQQAADVMDSGCVCGNVCGCYVHGIFDAPGTGAKVASIVTGMTTGHNQPQGYHDYRQFKEEQYDILADMIRQNMDMKAVYACLREAAVG